MAMALVSLLTVSEPSIWPELVQSVLFALKGYTKTVLVAFDNEQLPSCCNLMRWYDSEVFDPELMASSKLFCTPHHAIHRYKFLHCHFPDLNKAIKMPRHSV